MVHRTLMVKQVQAASRRVARDFDPADMVAFDAPAQQESGNPTDTLRQQRIGQLMADIEAAETPEDRAAAEVAAGCRTTRAGITGENNWLVAGDFVKEARANNLRQEVLDGGQRDGYVEEF